MTMTLRAWAIAWLSAVQLSGCARSMPVGTPTSTTPSAPSVAGVRKELQLTYLGVAGWSLVFQERTLLLDPYFSRIDVQDRETPLLPDASAIARYAPARVDYILVGHSHYDHLLDVSTIALRTHATVVGTSSTLNVMRAGGVAESHLELAVGGRELHLGVFTVRPLTSLHSLTGEQLGSIPEQVTLPMAARDYQEGTTLAYLVAVGGRSLIFIDSANFDEAALAGVHPDIAVVATALREKVPGYTCRLLTLLGKPGVVLPNHFDAHWLPLEGRATRIEPEQKEDLVRFTEEVAACAPSAKVTVPESFEPLSL